nr:MAG TPA: hypothetical protein [Caudoviricetes sp.]
MGRKSYSRRLIAPAQFQTNNARRNVCYFYAFFLLGVKEAGKIQQRMARARE